MKYYKVEYKNRNVPTAYIALPDLLDIKTVVKEHLDEQNKGEPKNDRLYIKSVKKVSGLVYTEHGDDIFLKLVRDRLITKNISHNSVG